MLGLPEEPGDHPLVDRSPDELAAQAQANEHANADVEALAPELFDTAKPQTAEAHRVEFLAKLERLREHPPVDGSDRERLEAEERDRAVQRAAERERDPRRRAFFENLRRLAENPPPDRSDVVDAIFGPSPERKSA